MSGVRGDAEGDLLHSGQQVDRYVVKDIVGRGGLAVVYRVEHTQLKSSFALKQLLVTSPDIRQRLRQEGIVQANVRHANLVLVTDMIELPTGPGLVMEFVDGPTLEQLLAGGQQLPVEDVDQIAEGLIAGVVAAHGKGLIHRDLKPGNVLLQTESGVHTPRITDFGFVKVLRGDTDLDLSVTRPGIQLGTPRYMAPEQATDARRVDQRADVYSLGAVLYELVTGQKAFPTADAGVVGLEESKRRDRYIPPHELRPQMPPRWQRAIEGALRADPTARVASASELLALWQGQNPASSVAAAGPVAAPERPASTPSPGAAGLRRGLTGAGIVAAGVVGTLLAWRAGTVELPDVTPAGASAVPARPVVKPTARVPEPESGPVPSARPTAPVRVVPAPAGPARSEPPPAAVVSAPPGPDRDVDAGSSPAPVPVPTAEAVPDTVPVVESLPQETDLPAGHGTVQVEGDTTGMYLQRGSSRLPPGGVPSGSYKIVQVVSGAQPVTMGRVEVVAGAVTTVRCSKRLKRCK